MAERDKLDRIINALYESVLEPDGFQEAIGLCGLYAGADDAQIISFDKKTNAPIYSLLSGTNFSTDGSKEYLNYYINKDPGKYLLEQPLQEWQYCHHKQTQKLINHNEFYQDFLLPYGIRYRMACRIYEDDLIYSICGFLRATNSQPFDEKNSSKADHYINHFQQVLKLNKHTEILQKKSELGAMAIDGLVISMILVNQQGTILHLNKRAETLLSHPDSELSNKMGRLTGLFPDQHNKLKQLIFNATQTLAAGGAMQTKGAHSRQILVMPLPESSKLRKDWQTPMALILINEPKNIANQLRLVGNLYGLSPAELKVATALLERKTLTEYAIESGISINTVKTQLRALFRKTETKKQAELVATLTQIPAFLCH